MKKMRKQEKETMQLEEGQDISKEKSFPVKKMVDDGIFLYYQQKHRKFLYKDILWIEASGSYCNIRLADHKEIVFVYTLYQLYEKLPKDIFMRKHRSYIVNIYAVTAFFHKVLYIGDKMLPISAPYLKDIISCFNCVDNRKALAKPDEQTDKPDRENKK